jgi:hypothetical protein
VLSRNFWRPRFQAVHASTSAGGRRPRRFVSAAGETETQKYVETPDHASIWRFRQTIDKLGLSSALLAEINRQLEARGFVIKRGTLVDATIIAGAVRCP